MSVKNAAHLFVLHALKSAPNAIDQSIARTAPSNAGIVSSQSVTLALLRPQGLNPIYAWPVNSIKEMKMLAACASR